MYQSEDLVVVKTNYPVLCWYIHHKVLVRVARAERQIKWEGREQTTQQR